MADEDIPMRDLGVRVEDASSADDIATNSLSAEMLTDAVDTYYNGLGAGEPATGRDYTKFKVDRYGVLRLKAHPDLKLIKRDGTPYALRTIASKIGEGGTDFIREVLGFSGWSKQAGLSTEAQAQIRQADGQLAAAQDSLASGAAQSDVEAALSNAEASLSDAQETALKTINDAPLDTPALDQSELMANYRELRGLDKAMRTQRGELVNNLARLTEIDQRIAQENRKLGETEDPEQKREIERRIRDLEDERAARMEAAGANREALRSQISRIRETLRQILREDTTLAERIRTLFREQGITIVSILTAIGMTISTLVLALTGGGGAVTPPTPPSPSGKGGVKEWIKKQLKALAGLLGRLAGHAAAALPGIIGSLVSWLLSTAGSALGWLAENTWALIVAVVGLLFIAAKDWLAKRKP